MMSALWIAAAQVEDRSDLFVDGLTFPWLREARLEDLKP